MASYGPWEDSFGGDYSRVYSRCYVENWSVAATQVTFSIVGGWRAEYNWGINNVEGTVWEYGDSGWVQVGSSSTFNISTGSSGGSAWEFSRDTYFLRRSADRRIRVSCDLSFYGTSGSVSASAQSADGDIIVPHLSQPIIEVSASRYNDNRINLTWTNPSSEINDCYIEVSIDGGSWSHVAKVDYPATSYAYTAASADHAYKFRVRTGYINSYSTYVESNTVYTTPKAPTSITLARESASSSNIVATLVNTSNTATSLEWQASTDQTTWGASTSISGLVTSFTATGLGGTYYLRVRNVRGDLASAWLVSDAITTICPPNPPTLISPTGVLSLDAENVIFSWLHNPLDGSAQTYAQLEYKTTGSWTTVTITGSANTYTMAIPWSENDVVTWRVKTKGADADYSDYSATSTFTCYQVPTLSFVNNKPPSTVSALPIPCEVTFTDPNGLACTSATVSLYEGSSLLFSESMDISGTALTASLTASEFLPEDDKTYTVTVTARSASTLQKTISNNFTVNYNPPKKATLNISNDTDTGYATLTIVPDTASGETITSLQLYRVTDHRQLLASQTISDSTFAIGVVDKYAPLNTTYTYEVITYASSGAFAVNTITNKLSMPVFLVYWGDSIASAKWNPESGGESLTRPNKTRVFYVGRTNPVSYDGVNVLQTDSLSFQTLTKSEMELFKSLIADGGRGIYKSADGNVYHADFELTTTPEYTTRGIYGGATLTIYRIEGELL